MDKPCVCSISKAPSSYRCHQMFIPPENFGSTSKPSQSKKAHSLIHDLTHLTHRPSHQYHYHHPHTTTAPPCHHSPTAHGALRSRNGLPSWRETARRGGGECGALGTTAALCHAQLTARWPRRAGLQAEWPDIWLVGGAGRETGAGGWTAVAG